MSSTSALTNLLSVVAEEVRDRILRDRALGLSDPFEETHTQNLISRLAELGQSEGLTVVAREVPKTVESKLLGADVALWVMGNSGVAALHLQCKRLFPDDTYRDLGHANKTGQQFKLLIDGAADVGAGAAYMFYNGMTDQQPSGSGCCLLDYSPTRNGITLAPAQTLKYFIGKPNSALARTKIEELCTPVVCLARCCGKTRPNAEDDPAAVVRAWYLQQTGDSLATVDVSAAPGYARPLFDDLAAALGRIPFPFDDEGVEEEDPETDQRPDPDENDDVTGVALAIAVAPNPR